MYNPKIEIFVQVADNGSFSKASEKMFVTPSALIKQINSLEEHIGVKLFIRTSKGLELTEAGKLFYEESKNIMRYSDEIVDKVKKVGGIEESTIKIGVSYMTPEARLIEIWAKIRENIPNIKLQLVPFENTPKNEKDILNNMGDDIDLVVGIYDKKFIDSIEVDVTKLYDISLCIGISATHKLAGKEIVKIEELFGETLMIANKGWNEGMDKLQDELRFKYPEINIENFDTFDINLLNECENNQKIIVLAENFKGAHSFLRFISVNWEYKTNFGIIHSKKTTKVVKKFINAIVNEIQK